jgi:enoyl-CoA hydratase/carnithine racemase
MSSNVVATDVGDTRTVTITRSERANSLDLETVANLTAAVIGADDTTKVLVLGSSGEVFCGGADKQLLADLASDDHGALRGLAYSTFQRLIVAIAECPVPVIMRIQGPALGAGADLAMAGDLKIASQNAWLEETWVKYGLVAALGGAYELTSTIGRSAALHTLLTAHRLDAHRCFELGLFQNVVKTVELDTTIDALTGVICQLDRAAIVATKAMVRRISDPGLLSCLRDARERQLVLFGSDGFRQALRGQGSAPAHSNADSS